jgi:hypothetical protein
MSDSIVITPFLYSNILMEVYNGLIYLPRGPFKNSYSVALYDFSISTTFFVINPTTMLSSQKYIVRVSLLSNRCSCTISLEFHYSCLI